jgi:hypothetical protein
MAGVVETDTARCDSDETSYANGVEGRDDRSSSVAVEAVRGTPLMAHCRNHDVLGSQSGHQRGGVA